MNTAPNNDDEQRAKWVALLKQLVAAATAQVDRQQRDIEAMIAMVRRQGVHCPAHPKWRMEDFNHNAT